MQRSFFQRVMLSSAMPLLNLPRALKRVLAVGGRFVFVRLRRVAGLLLATWRVA